MKLLFNNELSTFFLSFFLRIKYLYHPKKYKSVTELIILLYALLLFLVFKDKYVRLYYIESEFYTIIRIVTGAANDITV